MFVQYTFESSNNTICTHLFIPFVIDPQTKIALIPTGLLWTKTTPTGYDFGKATPSMLPCGVINLFQVNTPMGDKKYRIFGYNRQGTCEIPDTVVLFLEAALQMPDATVFIPYWDLGHKARFTEEKIAQQLCDGVKLFQEKHGNPPISVFIGVDAHRVAVIETLTRNGIALFVKDDQTPIM